MTDKTITDMAAVITRQDRAIRRHITDKARLRAALADAKTHGRTLGEAYRKANHKLILTKNELIIAKAELEEAKEIRAYWHDVAQNITQLCDFRLAECNAWRKCAKKEMTKVGFKALCQSVKEAVKK